MWLGCAALFFAISWFGCRFRVVPVFWMRAHWLFFSLITALMLYVVTGIIDATRHLGVDQETTRRWCAWAIPATTHVFYTVIATPHCHYEPARGDRTLAVLNESKPLPPKTLIVGATHCSFGDAFAIWSMCPRAVGAQFRTMFKAKLPEKLPLFGQACYIRTGSFAVHFKHDETPPASSNDNGAGGGAAASSSSIGGVQPEGDAYKNDWRVNREAQSVEDERMTKWVDQGGCIAIFGEGFCDKETGGRVVNPIRHGMIRFALKNDMKILLAPMFGTAIGWPMSEIIGGFPVGRNGGGIYYDFEYFEFERDENGEVTETVEAACVRIQRIMQRHIDSFRMKSGDVEDCFMNREK